jgi:hemerythrin-like domain-containing protein
VNVDIGAMGGDTYKEHIDKESLSLIPTSPQTLTSSDGETFNQLASKARDSLRKRKRVL